MAHSRQVALILVLIFGFVHLQVIQEGKCTDVRPVSQFNVTAYMGKWWGIAAYPQEFQLGGACGWAEYTLMQDGTVHVKNNMVVGNVLVYIEGSAYQLGDYGLLMVSLNFQNSAAPLRVIATDYEDYSVAFNCFDLNDNQRRLSAWILSKNQQLSEESKQKIDELVNSIDGLDHDLFLYSTITDDACTYDGEIEFWDYYFDSRIFRKLTLKN